MNNSTKGAVWSGLVFPGLGQVVLKQYKRGAVIMLTVSVSMGLMAVKAVEQALAVLEKLALEGGAISISTITKVATEATAASGSPTYNYLLLLIICCWLISIVDAYMLGRRIDNERPSPGLKA